MRYVSRETSEVLERFHLAVAAEAANQNLVSAGSLADFRNRHIEDSLQLLDLAPQAGAWVDIGSGGGFPGMVIALATACYRVTLVEPRAKRAAFLSHLVGEFGIGGHTQVVQGRVETLKVTADIISARAVAPLDRLFGMARHLASGSTVWLLPKGRGAACELAAAGSRWTGDIRLVPSRTDPSSSIVVARGVHPRAPR